MDINKVEEAVKRDLSWIQRHERILIVTLVLVVALFLGNKWLDWNSNKWENRAIVAEQQVEQQKQIIAQIEKQNATLAEETEKVKAQYQQIVDSLERQNASLAAAVTARNNNLAQQQANVQTAPLDDVAKSIISLAKLNTGDLTVSGSNGIVTQFGMRQIASELLRIPVLTANLTDIQTIADNKQKELDKANELVNAQNTQVSGLTNQILALNKLVVDKDTACEAKVNQVKAEARKGKRNWFIGGALTGIALGAKIASLLF